MSFLAELEQLQREASALASWFASTRVDAAGTDPTGTVQVTVTGDGSVGEVSIDPAWRARFGPDGLGDALAAATADASGRRLARWAERLGSAPPVAAPSSLPAPPVSEPSSFPAPPVDPVALDELHYLAVEAAGRLRELNPPVAPAAVGASADRRVRVTVTGGQVTAVGFDRGWLRSASVTAIAAHAAEALRAAFAAALAPGPPSESGGASTFGSRPGAASGALDEVRALTADPAALLRRLGLR